MQILQLILNNWRLIAFLSGLTLSALIGYNTGANNVQARWNASIQAIEKATVDKERELNEKSNIIDRELQNAQKDFNDNYDVFINELYATSLHKTNTTSKHNATACNNGISTKDKAYIAKLANDADKQTQQLIACQSWIKEVTK